MTNPTLVRTALKILRNPEIWKIAFDLQGLCVTGVRYSMVAAAIEAGDISCETVAQFTPQPGQTLPQGSVIEAVYKPEANTMLFGSESYGTSNIFEQTVILHEATHAIFDLYAKGTNDRVLAINDEAAATLAQALYMRLCGADRAVHRFSMFIDSAGDYAIKLADSMIAERGEDRRTYFLQPKQTEDLRAAVAQEWGFTKKYDADGKGGYTDSSGVLYTYNGVVKCFSCLVKK
jgi:hypothetical protein